MIVSASRRTDIPAFYAEWFMNRVRAGFVLVRNPFNARQVRRVELTPEAVTAVVFWTRNAGPLLPHLPELEARGLPYVFQYTITGYPRALEPAAPPRRAALDAFAALSARIGPQRVLWRYDPLLLCDLVDEAAHLRGFGELAAALAGKTAQVTISFVELYRKAVRNLARAPGLGVVDRDPARLRALAARLAEIAAANGIVMRSCACGEDLSAVGIAPGACVDGELLARLSGAVAQPYDKGRDKGQRPNCRCAKSADIGQYDTCVHGCAYCYATSDVRRAAANRAAHDPQSPLLLGWPDPPPPSDEAAEPARPGGPRQGTLF